MPKFVRFVAFVLLATPIAPARAGYVVNGGFETGINPGSFALILPGDPTSIAGWTVGGGGGVDYVGSLWTAGEGSRSVDLSGLGAGSISQVISGLVAGTAYDVSFLLAGNADRSLGGNTNAVKHLLVSAANQSRAYTFDITGHTTSSMGWTRQDFIFVAGGTSATLTFASQDNTAYAARPRRCGHPAAGIAHPGARFSPAAGVGRGHAGRAEGS